MTEQEDRGVASRAASFVKRYFLLTWNKYKELPFRGKVSELFRIELHCSKYTSPARHMVLGCVLPYTRSIHHICYAGKDRTNSVQLCPTH